MILGHESLDSAASPPLDARSSHLRLTWVAFIEGWPPPARVPAAYLVECNALACMDLNQWLGN